jgi:hypothetical protein
MTQTGCHDSDRPDSASMTAKLRRCHYQYQPRRATPEKRNESRAAASLEESHRAESAVTWIHVLRARRTSAQGCGSLSPPRSHRSTSWSRAALSMPPLASNSAESEDEYDALFDDAFADTDLDAVPELTQMQPQTQPEPHAQARTFANNQLQAQTTQPQAQTIPPTQASSPDALTAAGGDSSDYGFDEIGEDTLAGLDALETSWGATPVAGACACASVGDRGRQV